jgi:hypothetical protein
MSSPNNQPVRGKEQKREDVQTIQETSKKWKALQLFGGIGFFVSLIFICSGIGSSGKEEASTAAGLGLLGILISIILYFWGRIGAWWYHE